MVDVNRILKDTVKRGKVKIGGKETQVALAGGNAKLVVLANNYPKAKEIISLAEEKKVPLYQYKSHGIDLGYACGKSFAVSVFAVIDEGESNILQLVKKRK